MDQAANQLPMTAILMILLFAVFGYFLAFPPNQINHQDDQEIRKRYRFDIDYQQEKPVKIDRLVIYPCRGIQGIEVDHVKVSKYGIKYDREWSVYYRNEKLSPITLSPEIKFTLLRQRIERDPVNKQKYLIFSVIKSHQEEAEKLPSKELKILIRKQLDGEVIETGKGHGISEGPEADAWFSKFLEKDVFLLRSTPSYMKAVPKKILQQSYDDDMTKGFVSKAAIHIINEASVRDLSERVLKKYTNPEDIKRMKIEAMPFRPNFIIDSGVAYSEDTIQEARIGNTMMRLVGYCSRCKAVTCNFETNDRNPELEPTDTLGAYRKHEFGTLFGTYHQVEIIQSQNQFRRLFPNYPMTKNRKFDNDFSIILKGDEIRVRVAEQRITFDPKMQKIK
eukprot:403360502